MSSDPPPHLLLLLFTSNKTWNTSNENTVQSNHITRSPLHQTITFKKKSLHFSPLPKIPHCQSSYSMEDFRSKSCKDGRMQIESYYYGGGIGKATAPPTSMHDVRCYSANHAGSSYSNPNLNRVPHDPTREAKLKKSKSSGTKNWSLSDPEMQRKRRVASYRVYAVEGKMKGSLKKSLRWIKNACTHVFSEWW